MKKILCRYYDFVLDVVYFRRMRFRFQNGDFGKRSSKAYAC